MTTATTVRLKGRTNKGKNRVREHGEEWRVVESRPAVSCCGGRPALHVEPVGDSSGRFARWVEPTGDPDFEVVATESA